MTQRNILFITLIITISIILTSCSSRGIDSPSGVVEAYYQALVKKNSMKAASLSCSRWESEAKIEAESFTAVSTSLENIQCKEEGKSGEFTVISCIGKIIANYGNEVLEIDLEKQNYQVIQENGSWRMCGYQ
jgi:hypothetical protein